MSSSARLVEPLQRLLWWVAPGANSAIRQVPTLIKGIASGEASLIALSRFVHMESCRIQPESRPGS